MKKVQERVRAHAVIRGTVQGVGYRWFVRETARSLGLGGWVRNLFDGDVEVEAEGSKEELLHFLHILRTGHPLASVDDITVQWHEADTKPCEGFAIKY